MCVILVNRAKHISYLFLDLRMFPRFHWNLFSQMCGNLPKPPLVGPRTMFHLLMIIVNFCGFIFSNKSMMCLMSFVIFLPMLNASYLAKSYVFNQTGVGNTKNLATHFFGNLALLTTSLVHTHTNKMARPKGSTVTLLTWVSPYYRMRLCPSVFGMRRTCTHATLSTDYLAASLAK